MLHATHQLRVLLIVILVQRTGVLVRHVALMRDFILNRELSLCLVILLLDFAEVAGADLVGVRCLQLGGARSVVV